MTSSNKKPKEEEVTIKLNSSDWANGYDYHDGWQRVSYSAGEWGTEYDVSSDKSDDFFEKSLAKLDEDFEEITLEIVEMAQMWAGHKYHNFKTLSPTWLTELNSACEYITNRIEMFFEFAYQELGELIDTPEYDFHESFRGFQFELDVMRVIRKSYEFSSGKSQGIAGILNVHGFAEHGLMKQPLLKPFTVVPWERSPVPPLVVPERPSVVLKVMSVSDSAPRVTAGFDDVFYNEPAVVDMLVDEDVKVGDKVIVKMSRWEGFGHLLYLPEYDGLAEPACPCSTLGEAAELVYDFDIKKETAKHEENWKRNWDNTFFEFITADNLSYIGKEYLRSLNETWIDDSGEPIPEKLDNEGRPILRDKTGRLIERDIKEKFVDIMGRPMDDDGDIAW